jgi:predicted ATP-grasp superfamily ATP-dependent carboligase
VRLLDINDFKQAIALFDREVINRAVSLSAAARNVLYNYKTFNLGKDFTTKLLRDTSVTPYTRLPISTDLATRDQLRDCRNPRQSTAICRFPLYSAIFH